MVRNRLSELNSRNKRLVGDALTELGKRMAFRWSEGFTERVVYREFFPLGLTALDDLDKALLGRRPNKSHFTAREEVIALVKALHLPLSVAVNCAEVKGELKRLPVRTVESVSDPNRLAVWQ